MKITSLKKIAILSIVALILNTISLFIAVPVAAADFTKSGIRFDRMVINNTNTNILVVAKIPTGTSSEASIGLQFATGFTIGTASAVAVSTTSLPSTFNGETVNAWPGIGTTAATVSGTNVTITSTNVTAGSTYGFYITNGVTNPSSTGQKTIKMSTHSDGTPDFSAYSDDIDLAVIATTFVSDNGTGTDDDQITVTATVSPTYTFDINDNDVALQTSLATVEYPGGANNGSEAIPNITVTTNANNGHVLWLKSSSASGLTSATTGTTIAFSGTAAAGGPTGLTAGTEGVVIDIDINNNSSGSLAISTEFNGASTVQGGTPSTTFQEIATATGPTLTATGDVVNFLPRVSVKSTTKAANDYTATFTIVGAGNF